MKFSVSSTTHVHQRNDLLAASDTQTSDRLTPSATGGAANSGEGKAERDEVKAAVPRKVQFAEPDPPRGKPAPFSGGRYQTEGPETWFEAMRSRLQGWAYRMSPWEMDHTARELCVKRIARWFTRVSREQGLDIDLRRAVADSLRAKHRWLSSQRGQAVANALHTTRLQHGLPTSSEAKEAYLRAIHLALWPGDVLEGQRPLKPTMSPALTPVAFDAGVRKFVTSDRAYKVTELEGASGKYTFVRKRLNEGEEGEKARCDVSYGSSAAFMVARREHDGRHVGLRELRLGGTSRSTAPYDDWEREGRSPVAPHHLVRMVELQQQWACVQQPREVLVKAGSRGRPPKAYIIDDLMHGTVAEQAPEVLFRLGPAHHGLGVRHYLRGMFDPLDDLVGRGGLHCDIKPTNYVVRDEDIRLTDFVLAARGAKTFQTSGTAVFRAPELRNTNMVTPASEMFSLGTSVLNLMLVGTDAVPPGFILFNRPFTLADWVNLVTAQRAGKESWAEARAHFLGLRAKTDGVDPTLSTVLWEMVDPSPERRPSYSSLRRRLREGDLALTAEEAEIVREAARSVGPSRDIAAHITLLEDILEDEEEGEGLAEDLAVSEASEKLDALESGQSEVHHVVPR